MVMQGILSGGGFNQSFQKSDGHFTFLFFSILSGMSTPRMSCVGFPGLGTIQGDGIQAFQREGQKPRGEIHSCVPSGSASHQLPRLTQEKPWT